MLKENVHLVGPDMAKWRIERGSRDSIANALGMNLDSLKKTETPPYPPPAVPSPRYSNPCPTFKIRPRFTWGEFESISYCWESDTREKEIIVDGNRIQITTNLEALLRELRHLPEAQTGMGFWVDGLCIDQDNTLERNHQVLLMQRIYSQSLATIVWLGSPVIGSDLAMDSVAHVADIYRVAGTNADFDFWSSNVPWKDLYALLSRVYWKRMWIIQELALNDYNTLFICGSRQLSRDSLVCCCDYLGNHAGDVKKLLLGQRIDGDTSPSNDLWNISYHVSRLFQISHRRTENLAIVLEMARKANVKDQRDKVYGLLGLMPTELTSIIQPNYALSQEDVYKQFAKSLLQVFESLDAILPWCTLDSGRSLPSWVPDWNKAFPRHHVGWLRQRRASGEVKPPPPRTMGVDRLVCKGIHVDSVASTSFSIAQSQPFRTIPLSSVATGTFNPDFGRYRDKEGLKFALFCTLLMAHPASSRDNSLTDIFWVDWDQLVAPDYANNSQMAEFWRAGMAEITSLKPDISLDLWELFDRFRHQNAQFMIFGQPFKSFFPNMRSYEPAFARSMVDVATEDRIQLQRKIQDLTAEHARNMTLAVISLEGRKLVTTKTGFIGLAPEAIEQGDVIAVLFGCNFPVALRRFKNCYKYVGECYIDGLMEGESVDAMKCGEYQAVDITLC